MAAIRMTNKNFATKLKEISAGDTVRLTKGKYREPLVFQGITGTEDRPVIITLAEGLKPGDVTLTSEISMKVARQRGNLVARKREKSGNYPTVGHLGEQAMLILRDCHFVIVDSITFDGCWPTGVFIDNSKYIAIQNCRFIKGSLAIVARGKACHDVVIQHCHWKQDTSVNNVMWNQIPWDRIHGASNNSEFGGVSLENDYRNWDGDFFRAWNVKGNFTFRKNCIEDAFNGIHFFNTHDNLAPGVEADALQFNGGRESTSNILIENNTFVRIRDNVFEPEYHAWNWVIRHNTLLDCYRPFSFEFKRAGWFYIYGNKGAFLNRPSMELKGNDADLPLNKRRRTPSLTKTKGTQRNEGPIYFFNNSWYFEKGKGLFPKMQLANLIHINNVTQFKKDDDARLFGNRGKKPSSIPFNLDREVEDEKSRFTRRWKTYNIQMNGDLCNDTFYPEGYRLLGYALGPQASFGNAQFTNVAKKSNPRAADLDFTPKSELTHKSSHEFIIEFPDGMAHLQQGNHDLGAVQTSDLYSTLDALFEFLPTTDWLPMLEQPEDIAQIEI